MATITSAIGLISGLPIGDLVDSLIAVQRRPIFLFENRLASVNTLRTELLEVSARLLSLRNSVQGVGEPALLQARSVTSSNESLLRAVADSDAAVGQFDFIVRRLARTHQLVSAGFSAADSPVLNPGTLTLESDAARLDRSTPLAVLRGGQGIRTGAIRITDRAGSTAEVDLSAVRSVEDVLTAINAVSGIAVNARVQGDRIVLEDQTGLASGNLTIADAGGGFTATDLGIVGSSATGRIDGADLVSLSTDLGLDLLNDGNGVRRSKNGQDLRIEFADGSLLDVDLSGRLAPDTALALLNRGNGVAAGSIRITNRDGQSADVDLSSAQTVLDVVAAINAAGIDVTAAIASGGIQLTDSTGGDGTLEVAELSGGTTARDLGLLGTSTETFLRGREVYRVETLGDVINAINLNPANAGRVSASISADGDHLELADLTTGPGEFSVIALGDSQAAADLGLLEPASGGGVIRSDRLLAGLESVLLKNLNGGGGVAAGVIRITDRSGVVTDVDLFAARSLADVIASINDSGAGVTARVSDSGLGIVLTDTSGGTGSLIIEDVSGSGAADLGIAFNGNSNVVQNDNLQRRYISESTRLDQLRGGQGIPRGRFRITNAAGQSAVVDLTQGNEVTVQDLLDEINSRGIGVSARINDNGDGILLTDETGGNGTLRVTEEDGGTTAATLRLLGSAESGSNILDASFETRIVVTSGDTLDSVAEKIRSANASASAAVINDGSAVGAFRLTISSLQSGLAGRFVVDGGLTGLSFDTLTRGQDAIVQVGGSDGATPLLISSATNTIENVVPGVRLELIAAGSETVSVSVTQDLDSVVERFSEFRDAYNDVVARIDELSTFDPETELRGVLLGDRSANQVRRRLFGFVTKTVSDQPAGLSRLSGLGFSLSGGRLKFDEEKFRAAYESDIESVIRLVTDEETGLAAAFTDALDELTDTEEGVLTRRDELLSKTESSIQQRIDAMEVLLESRRQRLLSQFFATERVLAQLQTQQAALAGLSFNT
ncbi:MAG: flagellar filament capping protein FliD, partial [Phycisphaerae bacterium]